MAMNTPQMLRRDRLRGVVRLCRAFTWNQACFRIGREKECTRVFDNASNSGANSWRAANSNIDMCVLERRKFLRTTKANTTGVNSSPALPYLFKAGPSRFPFRTLLIEVGST
jgi:hypothetical protein